VIILQGN